MLMSYGVLLMRRGEYEKAKEVYLRVHYKPGLSKDDRFDLRNNYSICLWRLGKLDEAIATIKRAAADNKTTLVYTTLGLFLILKADQSGDFSEAIAFNDEAYEYDDEDPAILDNLGFLHMTMEEHARRAGDAEKVKAERKLAYDYFTRAHKLKPRQITTLYYLAKMLEEDGQKERAREFIDAALQGTFSSICPVSREDAEALRDRIAPAEKRERPGIFAGAKLYVSIASAGALKSTAEVLPMWKCQNAARRRRWCGRGWVGPAFRAVPPPR